MSTRSKHTVISGVAATLLVVLLITLSHQGCRRAADVWPAGAKTRILVTVPPLYCFAKSVAGNDAAVLCLLAEHGPHGFNPGPQDKLKARKTNLILAVGLGLDEFTNRLVEKKLIDDKKIEIVELGEDVLKPKKLLLAGEDHDEDDAKNHKDAKDDKTKDGKHDKEEHHHHGEFDPHVWLGIDQALALVEYLGEKFGEIDSANKAKYSKRAADYMAELKKLREDGLNDLKAKKNKKLITMHESLQYFANSFGLEIVGSIQIRPGIDADAAKIAELAKACKEKDVRVIAIEPQYPVGAAETLRKHLKGKGIEVELVTVDPLETAPPDKLDAAYYVSKMRENIRHLAEKLK